MRNYLLIALCAMLLPFSVTAQYTGEHYVMHSSGMHLAKSSASAVLESASADSPQQMTITSIGDGWYNIQASDGTYLAQSGSNDWNSGFIASGSGDAAKFRFDHDGAMLLIKNKKTGKYLGVDDTNDGSWVFVDKDGKSPSHRWFLSDDVTATAPQVEYQVIVNPQARRQEFEGFGVSLCWWAHMCGDWKEDKIDEIIDWLASPDQLNYRVFRYNIGGGDDPENRNCLRHHMADGKGVRAEMPGFKKYEDSEYDWSADEAQIKIMRKIKAKRPDAIFEAFSNSAPWWMTYSGCCSGNANANSDNLKPEYYEAFAHYLVDVCKHMKEVEGIEFRTLDPFNEPMTNYWVCGGGQEGCHFDVASQIAFIKVLYPILQASGLNTVISASDETDIAQEVRDFEEFKKADVLKYIGQINSHTYSGNTNACSNLSAQCAEFGMPLWMSEVGASGSGIQGNLAMASHLIRDIRYIEPNAWCDWQYIEEGNDQWCLVQAGFKSQNHRKVNNFYVRQHFSKYILPGYTFLTSTNDNTLVAIDPQGTQIVLVVVNAEEEAVKYKFDLGFFKGASEPSVAVASKSGSYFNDLDYTFDNGYLKFKIEGLSVVTLVVPVEIDDAIQHDLVDGDEYLLLARNNNGAAVTARDNRVALQNIDMSADQIWTLSKSGDKYALTNQEGNKLTATGEYAMTYSAAANGTQTFTLTNIGNDYYKIEANGKAMDLEGEGLSAGTGVGMWDYGTGNNASHRQFRLVRIFNRHEWVPGGIDDTEIVEPIEILPGRGAIRISHVAGNGQVAVYTLEGRCIYSRAVIADVVDIPMPQGVYVVAYANGNNAQSRIVSVR